MLQWEGNGAEAGLKIVGKYLSAPLLRQSVFITERDGQDTIAVALGDGDLTEKDVSRLFLLGWRYDANAAFFYCRTEAAQEILERTFLALPLE